MFFGRDGQVQKLLVSLQENLRLLEQRKVFRIGDKLEELQQLTEALAQDDDGRITHTGSGNISITSQVLVRVRRICRLHGSILRVKATRRA